MESLHSSSDDSVDKSNAFDKFGPRLFGAKKNIKPGEVEKAKLVSKGSLRRPTPETPKAGPVKATFMKQNDFPPTVAQPTKPAPPPTQPNPSALQPPKPPVAEKPKGLAVKSKDLPSAPKMEPVALTRQPIPAQKPNAWQQSNVGEAKPEKPVPVPRPKPSDLLPSQQLQAADRKKILQQARRFPLMRGALEYIGKNRAEGERARVQVKNLQILSELFSTGHHGLLQLSLEDKSLAVLHPYLRGEKDLSTDKDKIGKLLQQAASDVETDYKARKAEFDKKMKNAAPPVSKRLLEKQVDLHKRKQLVRAWAAEQSDIEASDAILKGELEKSDTSVYQFSGARGGKSIAFYKEGVNRAPSNPSATAKMEKLVYDMASFFPFVKDFATTGTIKIPTKAAGGSGEEMLLLKGGELTRKNNLASRAGSFQPAQEGESLKQFKKSGKDLSLDAAIEGNLIILLFGMWDAHDTNLIISGDRNVKFFDNTRSMPPSNEVIKLSWGVIIPACRNELLELRSNEIPFDASTREKIKAKIEEYKKCADQLCQFLELEVTQKSLDALPPGWVDKKAMLDAFKERVERLEKAINDPEVKNLRDLNFAVFPENKFFALLTAVGQISSSILQGKPLDAKEICRKSASEVGQYTVRELMVTMTAYQFNVGFLKKMCTQFSYEDLVNYIIKHPQDFLASSQSEADTIAWQMEQDYARKAKNDFKD